MIQGHTHHYKQPPAIERSPPQVPVYTKSMDFHVMAAAACTWPETDHSKEIPLYNTTQLIQTQLIQTQLIHNRHCLGTVEPLVSGHLGQYFWLQKEVYITVLHWDPSRGGQYIVIIVYRDIKGP